MQIRSKLWVEVDGKPVFGRGRRFLLEAIDKHGSMASSSLSAPSYVKQHCRHC